MAVSNNGRQEILGTDTIYLFSELVSIDRTSAKGDTMRTEQSKKSNILCGLFSALVLGLSLQTASADDAAVTSSVTVMPEINLAQYSNTNNPTTIAFNVNAMMAGGDVTSTAITAAATQALGAGYKAVEMTAAHRIEVNMMILGDARTTQVVDTATLQRNAQSPGFMSSLRSRFGASEVPDMLTQCALVARVSITVDGQALPGAQTVIATMQGPKLTAADAKPQLEVLLGKKLASFFTGTKMAGL